MSKSKQTAILLVGPHRAGTSAAARVLNLFGAQLPERLLEANHANPSGYWEPKHIASLNERMLVQLGRGWDDWRPIDQGGLIQLIDTDFGKALLPRILEDYGNSPLFVLKDPRVSRLLPLYRSILKKAEIEIRIVIAVRNPIEVIDSLVRRDEMNRANALLIWLSYLLDAEKYSREFPRTIVDYDRLLDGSEQFYHRSAKELRLTWPGSLKPMLAEVSRFLSHGQRHSQASVEMLEADDLTADWALRALKAFNILETDPGSRSAKDSLDLLGIELAQSCRVFGPMYQDYEQSVARIKKRLDEQQVLYSTLERRHRVISKNRIRFHLSKINQLQKDDSVANKTSTRQFYRPDNRYALLLKRELAYVVRLSKLGAMLDARIEAQQIGNRFHWQHYATENPDLKPDVLPLNVHYCRYGRYEGRTPHPLFDTAWYLQRYPDVANAGINPFFHYLDCGWCEGRNPGPNFDTQGYLNQVGALARGDDPVSHYMREGLAKGYKRGSGAEFCRVEVDAERHYPETIEQLATTLTPVFIDCAHSNIQQHLWRALDRFQPKVSVIIPTWNRRNTLGAAIESVLAQSYPVYEIIVSDDGSTDDTEAWLRSQYAEELDAEVLIWISSEHRGVSAARNRALEISGGDYIAYLDSDNCWYPDHLLFVVGYMCICQASWCYSGLQLRNLETGRQRYIYMPYDRDRLLRSNYVDLNAFVHSRELYLQRSGFDEHLSRLVDWDLVLRYTQDSKGAAIPIISVDYRVSESLDTISKTSPLRINAERVQIKFSNELIERSILSAQQLNAIHFRVQEMRHHKPLPKRAIKIERQSIRLYLVIDSYGDNISQVERYRAALPRDLIDICDLEVIPAFYRAQTQTLSISGQDYTLKRRCDRPRRAHLPLGCYWYPGNHPSETLTKDQLLNMIMALAWTENDVVILSGTLARLPALRLTNLRHQCLFSRSSIEEFILESRIEFGEYRRIKVLRFPITAIEKEPIDEQKDTDVEALFDEATQIDPHYGYITPENLPASPAAVSKVVSIPNVERPKVKRIFVIPMKMAVGGVERNTIEVMRQLQGHYQFIYLALEQIELTSGNLSEQIAPLCHRIINLAESASHGQYLQLLAQLKTQYQPDLVWICNGSMWLWQNASPFRELYQDVPIVDQQVYDTEQGWVQHYHEPGIQAFDRFIAINSRIKQHFIEKLNMDPAGIDLIYSMVDAEKFKQLKDANPSQSTCRDQFGLPQGKRILAFMGRLTEQKRPLAFLELALSRQHNQDEFYVMVGDGGLADACQEWISRHQLENLKWIKNIPDTRPFWLAVDGLLVLSAYEGLPIVVIEALSMGRPVLSTDVGDVGLVLTEHQAGELIIDADNAAVLEQTMNRWVADLEQYHQHLQLESIQILNRFSASHIATQYQACFETALAAYSDRS